MRTTTALSIYILCGNATYNRGDRANLTAQLDLLRSVYPDAQITVGSFRPEVDARWYDATFVQRGCILSASQWKAMRSADIIIWGGGSLLTDHTGILSIPYWFCLLLLIKIFLHKPVMAWAQGLVIHTILGAFFAKRVFSLVDIATVRDHDSYLIAKRLSAKKVQITETADPAILLEGTSLQKGESILREQGIPTDKPLIGVTPTFWPLYHRTYDLLPYAIARRWGLRKHRGQKKIMELLSAYQASMDLLIEHLNCNILLLPRYANDPWPDITYLRQLKRSSKHPERVYLIEADTYAPKEYFSLWHHFSCLLSGTMHDCIVACAVGTPCVHIVYEKKGEEFSRAAGMQDYVLPLEEFLTPQGQEKAAELVRRCVALRKEKMQMREECRMRLRKLAEKNLEIFDTLVERALTPSHEH
ncbi:hypothetical protein A2454_03855 [Candidatus Peribacteria bacterium RIFOXYC2_FULL_55_14]|nr:MAG: Polysaccharide pyruvyl transferase [Candidatus Peribacteria bacterium GW2011_GWB1_54_5]OGJ71554.1 MAG: hypothetical protein A2198_05110 [Candidatus Peribacteria bacterium RIFOXYA1_FULL_56_14]OGJ72947.1 MAG: hypothetical protein A2217_06620 [Candidatus Peribacteria bacterium RIFOXYA2_FULL_55_28]OGJ73936.1 MAG: hypothetical protein A2384_04890 [Candidatus Peribacteria bacterium RIFOXYB1_FULL_54_35]OGJ76113.1 MAG: hypothetical protein A2327_04360 [Candidatus Peribacteria bacterium RIFOXYB2